MERAHRGTAGTGGALTLILTLSLPPASPAALLWGTVPFPAALHPLTAPVPLQPPTSLQFQSLWPSTISVPPTPPGHHKSKPRILCTREFLQSPPHCCSVLIHRGGRGDTDRQTSQCHSTGTPEGGRGGRRGPSVSLSPSQQRRGSRTDGSIPVRAEPSWTPPPHREDPGGRGGGEQRCGARGCASRASNGVPHPQ